MSDYLPWALAHFGALVLMLLCAAGLGNLFLRKCRFHNPVERFAFTIALGLGLCALLLFVLGVLGFLYQLVIRVVTVAGAMVTVLNVIYANRRSIGVRQSKQVLRSQWEGLHSLRGALTALLIIIGIGLWVFLLM